MPESAQNFKRSRLHPFKSTESTHCSSASVCGTLVVHRRAGHCNTYFCLNLCSCAFDGSQSASSGVSNGSALRLQRERAKQVRLQRKCWENEKNMIMMTWRTYAIRVCTARARQERSDSESALRMRMERECNEEYNENENEQVMACSENENGRGETENEDEARNGSRMRVECE